MFFVCTLQKETDFLYLYVTFDENNTLRELHAESVSSLSRLKTAAGDGATMLVLGQWMISGVWEDAELVLNYSQTGTVCEAWEGFNDSWVGCAKLL